MYYDLKLGRNTKKQTIRLIYNTYLLFKFNYKLIVWYLIDYITRLWSYDTFTYTIKLFLKISANKDLNSSKEFFF